MANGAGDVNPELVARVLAACDRPQTSMQLANRLDGQVSIYDVSRVLSSLRDAGRLTQDDRGRWVHPGQAIVIDRVQSSTERLGFVVNAVVASMWLLLWIGVAALGIYYMASGPEDGSFGDELGDAIGFSVLLYGALAGGATWRILQVARRPFRQKPVARWEIPFLLVVDVLGIAASAWFFFETFRTASGDGHSANPVYVLAWVLNGGALAVAAAALLSDPLCRRWR